MHWSSAIKILGVFVGSETILDQILFIFRKLKDYFSDRQHKVSSEFVAIENYSLRV